MEQDPEHQERDKNWKGDATDAADTSLATVGREQILPENPRHSIPAPSLPSLHFSLVEEEGLKGNVSPHSERIPQGRQLRLSPSDNVRPHSVGPDQRRHSIHSKPLMAATPGLLAPGSITKSRRHSEGRRRSSMSGLPPDPNMEDPVVTYPLSLTRSRNSVVGSSTRSSFGYGDFIPQEQPGQHRFFDLASSGSNNKRTKPLRSSSDAGHRQDQSGNINPSFSVSSPSASISSESNNSTNSVPFALPPPPPPSFWRKFRNQLSNRVLKRHFRFMVALYLSSSMTLIRPVANFLGPTPYLANTIVVFMHPARTVGSQLEVTLFSIIGAILATAWIIPCQVSVAAYNRQFFAKHGTLDADGHMSWLIEAVWFFFGIWIMTALKARYAKLTYTFLFFTIANIFGYSKTNDNVKFNIHAYWNLVGPMLIGVGICLLVSIVFWPETASEGLGRALNESLDTSRALLNLSTRSFLLNHKTIALPKSVIENAQKEVRDAQKKLFSAYREARYEVTFATTDPADYKEVRVVVSALMRHLGSMSLVVQNERLLMLGHPDRENDDLETDSEEESDLAGSGETSSDTDHSVSDTDTDIRGSWDQGSTSGKSTASDYMAGDRRRGRPRKHKRGSAAELRRIRQLLMRAEMSTDALLQAQKAQDEEKGLQEGARPYHLGDNVLGSATAPSTPGGSGSRGRRSSIFEKYSLSRFSTGSGDIMGRTGSPGTERITTSIAQYPVSPSTPTHDSQHSRRPSSPQGDRGNSHPEGFISQQSGISTETFKPTLLPSHNKPSPRNVDRSVKLQGSGTVGAMNPTSGVDMILGTSPISGLPSSPSIDKRSRAHSDGGAGVRSNVDESLKKIPSRYSVSGSFSGHRVHKTMGSNRGKRRKDAKGATKPAKRKAKKEPKRKKEEEVKDIPPKEVAFGDRRLFLSFLDVVRDPLQRLSDSCSRSMASIERELVIGLNVEKDMKERLRKRNSHRDAIVRRAATATAEGNPLQKVTPPSTSDLHPSSEDASIGNGSSQHRQSLWQRVRHRIGVSSHPLTQGELDFMDVVRGTTEKEKKHKVSKSGIPADGIHPRKLQQHSTAVESLGDCMEEAEGSSILPGDISCVQYLTQELGIFDQAEASGLRGFIASNPTLDVGPREEIFLVFFYIFALREIARELLRLGSHLEEMKRKQEIQMELDGRKKPRRRLWWPKVIGNFEHWFSWGSYSQTRATEGFSGMVMRSTKNLERRQPRLIAEEKAHIEAKAAKAAEQEAKRVALENARREEMDWRDRLRRGRNPESWNTSKPRRSVTMSAFMSRPAGPPGDLEVGMTRLAPQPGRSSPLSSRLGRVRAWTFLSPSNKRTDTPLDAPQGDISVHPLSTDTSRSAMEASGYQDGPKTGNESHLQGRYTVVDIPEFQSLHPNPTYDNNSDTSASSSKMNTIQPRATTPSEVNPLDADETLERTLEPPSPSQRRPSQVPLLKVTYDGQSDDNDDSEDSSFEKDVGMGYKKQPPRKRTQSAFAEVSSRYSGHDSGLSEKPKEKHRYREPTPKSAPTPPPPPPAFVNVPKPRSMRYRIWEFLQEFESDEVRYGLKMASALTFVGLWAWLGWTYQILATDRGQWVMMTIVAVLSPTIGATFSVCAWRVGGTLAGILWAMLTYLAHPRDPFVILAMMPVITFTVAYCILISTHPTMGVIMMLSYNSIIFGVYHGRTNDNIYVTCYKVAITMIIGILISVALNTFLWPVLARRELRKEIALLIGRQGVLFAELVNKYLLEEQAPREIQQPDEKTDSSSERSSKDKDGVAWTEEDEKSSVKESLQPSSMGSELVTGSGRKVSRQHISDSSHRQDRNLLDGESHHSSDEYKLDADQLAFQHVEHQLQTKLIKICQLLDLSASEPRLKEDFPGKLYKQIVQCCQNILDRMVSMRMAAQLLSTEVRYLVTGPMNYYRRDMVGALLLYFSVLSSSLASKTALPPYLPSARMARLRVIYNVRQAIAAHQAETGEDHYTYIYYYAFSSALEEVIEELELLAILIKPLVGVTLVSSSEGHPCGVSADQLSLGSAIPSIQMPVPSLQPGAGTAAVLPADGGSDLRFGLGTGIMQAPGPSSGILTGSGNTSEQAQLEQQLQLQQIELQRQQLQGIHPDLVLPNEPVASPMKGVPSGGEATDLSPSSQQRQQQKQSQHSDHVSGPKITPILTQPFASPQTPILDSPVVIMNPMLLDNRHAQRFKEAVELANEVSSTESSSNPASSTTMSRSSSLRKKISERIKNTPLIKDVFSPEGHHRRIINANESSMSPQILPQRLQEAIDTNAEGSLPTKGESSPRHGLGLALNGALINQAEDVSSQSVHPPN